MSEAFPLQRRAFLGSAAAGIALAESLLPAFARGRHAVAGQAGAGRRAAPRQLEPIRQIRAGELTSATTRPGPPTARRCC